MKKSFLLITAISLISVTHAQTGFGPEAGFAYTSKQIIAPGSFSGSSSYIPGGKIGCSVDIDMDTHFYLQSGLFFSMKGNKDVISLHQDSNSVTIKETVRINYMEAPLCVVYKTKLQGNGRLYIGIGAYFGYVVSGNDNFHTYGAQVINGSYQSFDTSGKYKLVPGNNIKAFDMGVDLTAGYELPTGLYFRAAYMAGITNTSAYTGEADKNRSFSISAGYYLGKDRHKKIPKDPLVIKDDR